MGSLSKKVVKHAYKFGEFGGLVGIGVIGSIASVGISAKHSMDKSLESFSDGLAMALISGLSMTSMEKTLSLQAYQGTSKNKNRQGFDWVMASAYHDNGPSL